MALDTRNKRSSAMNLGSPWRGLWPSPDGTVSGGDKEAVAFMYSGFARANPGPTITGTIDLRYRVAGTVDLRTRITGTIGGA